MTREKLYGYGCPECGSQDIRHDAVHDEDYCHKCGLVICAGYYQSGVVFPGLQPLYKP